MNNHESTLYRKMITVCNKYKLNVETYEMLSDMYDNVEEYLEKLDRNNNSNHFQS